ncbi:MAG: Asp-tRNA(Asn)/Glu-tRNA(Gln) amidotransferase subunit GatC [Candidatus Pacebacteria bacterium]|nr:Asp-tRNA(Asn)/Glu-tRNA(Gln) amidotransferase subunit GatC [Candidatus Paceibacterota bacterium]
MISEEEVKHIAKLARLGLTDKEVGKFQKELSSILDYFEKLKKIDVSDVEPSSRSFAAENVLRRDEIKEEQSKRNRKLLELAPETKDGYLKVKPIIKFS